MSIFHSLTGIAMGGTTEGKIPSERPPQNLSLESYEGLNDFKAPHPQSPRKSRVRKTISTKAAYRAKNPLDWLENGKDDGLVKPPQMLRDMEEEKLRQDSDRSVSMTTSYTRSGTLGPSFTRMGETPASSGARPPPIDPVILDLQDSLDGTDASAAPLPPVPPLKIRGPEEGGQDRISPRAGPGYAIDPTTNPAGADENFLSEYLEARDYDVTTELITRSGTPRALGPTKDASNNWGGFSTKGISKMLTGTLSHYTPGLGGKARPEGPKIEEERNEDQLSELTERNGTAVDGFYADSESDPPL